MIIGVDLGNYGVKTSEKVSFLSKVSDAENFTDENKVVYEGKSLYVGEGEFSTDWNKSMKETILQGKRIFIFDFFQYKDAFSIICNTILKLN